MSLINQMLQDLDARGQQGSGASIHAQVRVVGETEGASRRWFILGGAVGALVVITAAAWFWFKGKAPAAVPGNSHVVTAVLPVGAEGPAGTSKSASPAPAVVTEAGAPVQFDLKMSPELTLGQGARAIAAASAPAPAAAATPVRPAESKAIPPLRETKVMKVPAPQADSPAKAVVQAQTAPPAPVTMPASARKAEKFEKEAVVNAGKGVPTPPPPKNTKEVSEQQRAENEYRNASLLIQQGKISEAMRGLEQAIYLDPLHGAARLTLVSLLIDAKQQNAAIRRLKEGLALEPGQASMAKALARMLVEKGEVKPAIEVLQRTLPYTGDNAEYRAFLAALLQNDGRHKEAIEAYLVAVRQNPQSGVWWMGLGISLQADARNADAVEAFTRAKATNALTPELKTFVDQRLAQLKR